MEPHALIVKPPGFYLIPNKKLADCRRHVSIPVHCRRAPEYSGDARLAKRREVLVTPFLAVGAYALRSAVAKAEEKPPSEGDAIARQNTKQVEVSSRDAVEAPAAVKEEVINSRIYDATVIGEPMALGKDKRKAEQVPIRDDKDLELEIVKSLRKRCVEAERPISLALEAFPCDLQEQLNRISGEALKSFVTHWSPQRWQEYEPLLNYCRDNGVRLVACGVPLEKMEYKWNGKVVTGDSEPEHNAMGTAIFDEGQKNLNQNLLSSTGSGFISGFPSISRRSSIDINFASQSAPYGPSSYLSIQAKVVEDYTMSQIIIQAVADGGSTGMLIVVTGANHVTYGSRGTGLPARISRKMQKKNQVVILLDPERQYIRREGEVPVADFLWYSAARPCSRNCFDRAEIARVMNAAGRRREALPQDLQNGLDLGLVSPEVLQNFFDLEQYPLISELTHRFQGFRERLLADPKFLHRLAIEETISITTTLVAQYERRKENFFEELDYVVTDTLRGIYRSSKRSFGVHPRQCVQKNLVGKDWNLNHRIASVVVGGVKLASVGFISSIGAVASSNILYAIRKLLNPSLESNKRSPILKTALVYSSFLGTSANLRYQVIAGIVEHRISDLFADQELLVNLISFVARTINSYWGTQQWVDLARYTGLQARKSEEISFQTTSDPSNAAALECNILEDTNIDESNRQ
ncbi:hypothetical protein DH2020_044258 [Rehmannia glutinosa]|uniref:Haem-binding uptake Tiki superfamily ChaN domain-containing protein n=1 Tax=Rehmannia glutinosa TaxID=99300 RepID=A0ABR0UI88_REHGL